ncbi:MAG: hypothetical protein GY757_48960 [bacterium]|nr:hypothetical protein [bacterium]
MSKKAKAYLYLILPVIFLFLTAAPAYSENTVSPQQPYTTVTPLGFASFSEYNPVTSTFYGQVRINKKSYFVSIDAATGKQLLKRELGTFDGWPRRLSSLDTDNHRLFFIAIKNKKYNLYTVDSETGRLLNSVTLANPVKAVEFEPETGEVFGFQVVPGGEKFISISPVTGAISAINKFLFIKGIRTDALLHIEKGKFLLTGSFESKTHVWHVDTRKGLIDMLPGKNVSVDEYKVVCMEKGREVLFTTGVQSCTAIAGISKPGTPNPGLTAFIAHFSPKYNNIPQALAAIDKQAGKNTGNPGLKNMKLVVVGGAVGTKRSVSNLRCVYKELVEVYGIKYNTITRFHTGVSKNIVIYKGEINVF